MAQKSNTHLLLRHYLSLTTSLLLVWSISFLVIHRVHYIADPIGIWSKGLFNQLLLGAYSVLLISPLYLFSKGAVVSRITSLLFGIIVTFEMASSFYFIVTLNPVDNTLFQFEWSQMKMIAGDFVVFKWYYLLLITPPVFYLLILRISRNLKGIRWLTPVWLTSIILSLFIGIQIDSGKSIYDNLSKNKTYYLLSSVLDKNKPERISTSEAISAYQKNEGRNFTNLEFPLEHEVTNENTLGPFFALREKEPPNIVFLIIESLSSSFSGTNANEISYTPFLDSLSEQCLYFENALSTGERTFAVLPSVLGSLPHGKKGFTHEHKGYPSSTTLLRLLSLNNYKSSFHYGGNARFDYMDIFLDDQSIQIINDQKEFQTEGLIKQEGVAPTQFGINDKKLFENLLKSQSDNKSFPFIDIVLTLSMHYPFIVEKQEMYKQKVNEILKKSKASTEIKKKHKKYIKAFSTTLYTDDALRYYFKNRVTQKDHKNTIYVILGDHMMTDIPHEHALEKYRSPLLIYSPLLTRSKRVKAVNSHLDIAPSIHNLLNQKYGINSLNKVYWLGSSFDTLGRFRNERSILFMRNERECIDLLDGNTFISNDQIYKLKPHLSLEKIESPKRKNELEILRSAYNKVHTYTVANNKIKPDRQGTVIYSDKNKALTVTDSTEFVSVLNVDLSNNYQSIDISIEMSLLQEWRKSKDERDETQPLLILSLNRKGDSYIWKKLDLELNSEMETPRKIHSTIKDNTEFDLRKGDQLSLYFWNKEKDGRSFNTVIHELKINGVKEIK